MFSFPQRMVLVFCFPTFLNGKIEFVLSFFRPNSSELSEAGTRAEKAEVAEALEVQGFTKIIQSITELAPVVME